MNAKSARRSSPVAAAWIRFRVPILASAGVLVAAGLAFLYWSQKKAQEYEDAYKKGMASWTRRDFEPALAQWRKAAQTDPRDPELWVAIGRVELTLDHADRAREAWEEALRREPEFKPALFERGKEAFYRHVFRRIPPAADRATGWLPLGLDFAAPVEGGPDEAKRMQADLRAGSGHAPEFLRFAKGALQLLEGQYREARPLLQSYSDENGWDAAAVAVVGIAALYGAAPDRAEKWLTEALSRRNETSWRKLRAQARYLQANYEGARSDYSGAGSEKEAEPLFARRIPSRGLVLWLKADAGVEVSGTSVSRWSDQSDRRQDAAPLKPETTPRLAAAAVGGRPAIVFAGGEDELRLPDGFEDFHAGLSMFVIGEPQTEPGEPWAFLFLATPSRGAGVVETLLGRRRESEQIVYAAEDVVSGKNPFVAGIAPAKGFDSFSALHEPAGRVRVFKRGQAAATGSLPLPPKVVRSRNRIGAGLKGQIAEILLYDRSLAELERLGVEAYLKDRYFPDPAAPPTEKR